MHQGNDSSLSITDSYAFKLFLYPCLPSNNISMLQHIYFQVVFGGGGHGDNPTHVK